MDKSEQKRIVLTEEDRKVLEKAYERGEFFELNIKDSDEEQNVTNIGEGEGNE